MFSEAFLTFHANEQQVRGQLPPATFSLLLINPVPVKTQEVHDNLPPHGVIERLLQIQPISPRKKKPSVCEMSPWYDLCLEAQLCYYIPNREQL